MLLGIGEKSQPRIDSVGQNLMVLSIFIFFVFIINFVVIIGADSSLVSICRPGH